MAATVAIGALAATLALTWDAGVPSPDAGGSVPPARVAEAAATGAPAVSAESAYGKLPLRFEANRGQTDSRVDFLARGAGYTLFLTPRESVLSLSQGKRSAVVRMRLAGGNPDVRAAGAGRLPGETNYIRGRDPNGWQTGVPGFGTVRYGGVYPGIDLLYYGKQGKLEYDFRVAPGADPGRIALDVSGARSLRVDRGGDLLLRTAAGTVRHDRPVAYQRIAGRRRAVAARFEVRGERVTFRLGAYDRSRPLVIDPVVVYSTFLGGAGGSLGDSGSGIAADAAGNAYVVGDTASLDFPTTPMPLRGPPAQGQDAFVSKFSADGTALVYSTYLGGGGSEFNPKIAVDSAGAAYVAGETGSTDLPSTPGVFQAAHAGGLDVFVAKLTPNGQALAYLTYLGASGTDVPAGIAVDTAGKAYVTGTTRSATFPTQAPFQVALAGGEDGFVAKLDAAGSALEYSSYLGGTGDEETPVVDVDSAGSAYVAGTAASPDFPTTAGAFDTICGTAAAPCTSGLRDGFVTKLTAAGGLSYSTFLGGAGFDTLSAIAVGRGAADAGRAYVTGDTRSVDFPIAGAAFQSSTRSPGSGEGFVTRVGATGAALEYSTHLGSPGIEDPSGIAVDGQGNAYVTGTTRNGVDFPEVRPVMSVPNRQATNGFALMVPSAGRPLGWSTLLRGAEPTAVAVDPAGAAYVTGFTRLRAHPTQNPLQPRLSGYFAGGVQPDAFVVKLSPDDALAPYVTGVSPRGDDLAGGRTVRITGTGFGDSPSVAFGGVPAADVDVVSSTELVVTAPPHAAGETRVTVTSAGRTSPANPASRFEYGEGRWRTVNAPVRPEIRRSATLLRSGRVLLAGGQDLASTNIKTRAAELFDPKTGTWEPTGQLSVTITSGGADRATLLRNGRVLLVHQNKTAEVYDPATGAWTRTAGNPAVSPGSLTTLSSGKVLSVVGGAAELYDPATDAFTPTAMAPQVAGTGHTATLLRDGRVLLVGGSGSFVGRAEIYDPATGAFTVTQDLALPRVRHTATLLPSGRVLVAGGNGLAADAVEVFDPATGSWSTTGPLSTLREDHVAVLLPNGRVLIAGGQNTVDTAELYDPGLGTSGGFRSAGLPNTSPLASGPTTPGGPPPTAIVLSSDPDGFASDPAVCGSNCGRVLVAGAAFEGTAPTSRAELYTPAPPVVPAPPGGGGDPGGGDPGAGGGDSGGGGASGGPGAPARDGVAPTVSDVRVLDREFSIGSLLPLLARQTRVGTTIRFRLSEQAAARMTFARVAAGRRVGSSCRRATARLRSRPRCTRYATVRPSVAIAGARAGLNSVHFQGRLSRSRTLRPGRYRLTVTATDGAGNRSRPQSTTFRLLPAPRRR